MKKPKPTKTLTIPEYNEKLKSLESDDAPFDEYLDLESKDAEELARKERKRVAQALLKAAAALEATMIPGDVVEALEMVQADVAKAIALAKRKQFDKAQEALESATFTADVMLQEDMFRDADIVEQAARKGGEYLD